MERTRRIDIALSRLAFLLFAGALATTSLLLINHIGTQALEARVGRNLDVIADADRAAAEASLDFGLPANGPGGVEELLQPPRVLSEGPDALSLRLEKLQTADRDRDAPTDTRYRRNGTMIAERAVSDSHGESTARLVVSRSMAGFDAANESRERSILTMLAVTITLLAGFLAFMPPWRAMRLPAGLFGAGVLALLLGFGSQAIDISRQGAALAVADTAGELSRATALGIPFDKLVGMLDYLKQQVASKPAIGAIEVRDATGVAYAASADVVGSVLADGLQDLGLSAIVDLAVEQRLESGISLEASVNFQPILSEIAILALVALVFIVSGGAMLRALWPDEARPLIGTAGATLPASLLFLLLFVCWNTSSGLSGVAPWRQFVTIAAAFAIGLAVPRGLAIFAIAFALVAGIAGFLIDGIYLLAAAAVICAGGFRRMDELPKPINLAAGLLPAICVAGAGAVGHAVEPMPMRAIISVFIGFIVVFSLLKDRVAGSSLSSVTVGLMSGAWLGNWLMACVFIMQLAGFLLVGLAARQMPEAIDGGSGSAFYFLLTALLYAIGGLAANMIDIGRRTRWVLYELAVLTVVLLIARAYAGGGPVLVDTAIAAFFMGVVGHWTPQLNLAMGGRQLPAKGVLACEFIAFALAGAVATEITFPDQAALPATIVYLVMLAPLAFVTIAGMSVRPRRMFTRSAG